MIVLQVSDWRYGCVSSHDVMSGLMTLTPWPDASVHPDPKVHQAHLLHLEDSECKPDEQVLEAPQSEYNEDGVLEGMVQDFVEVYSPLFL